MTRSFVVVALASLLAVSAPLAAEPEPEAESAVKAADEWLALLDSGSLRKSWSEASPVLQKQIPQATWVDAISTARRPLGRFTSRTFSSSKYTESVAGAPPGKYVIIAYEAAYQHKEAVAEIVTVGLVDDSWRVSGYSFK